MKGSRSRVAAHPVGELAQKLDEARVGGVTRYAAYAARECVGAGL